MWKYILVICHWLVIHAGRVTVASILISMTYKWCTFDMMLCSSFKDQSCIVKRTLYAKYPKKQQKTSGLQISKVLDTSGTSHSRCIMSEMLQIQKKKFLTWNVDLNVLHSSLKTRGRLLGWRLLVAGESSISFLLFFVFMDTTEVGHSMQKC